MACQDVKTVGIRHKLISKRYQQVRERDLPYGLQDALCTLAPSCSRVTPLRHGTNTRYGRAANPYPTGTFTRQETPSFARRDNAKHNRLRAKQDGLSKHKSSTRPAVRLMRTLAASGFINFKPVLRTELCRWRSLNKSVIQPHSCSL